MEWGRDESGSPSITTKKDKEKREVKLICYLGQHGSINMKKCLLSPGRNTAERKLNIFPPFSKLGFEIEI